MKQDRSPKSVIILAGPTGVGKTKTAIALAQHFNTSIISADSRQCYRELNIGVARPSAGELESADHYFIASHSIHDKVDAAVFEQYALEKLGMLFNEKDVVIVAGGTGLYIKTLCEGLDAIPAIAPGLREQIITDYERHGLDWLQQKVAAADPAFYQTAEIQNPQRLIRALEIIRTTGAPLSAIRKGKKIARDFQIIKIGLHLPKDILHQQIHHRVDQMIENGLVDEVQTLLPYRHLNALQTVGYSEIIDCLDGKKSLRESTEKIKINTRHYAKRQLTWFRKDKDISWFEPNAVEEILAAIKF